MGVVIVEGKGQWVNWRRPVVNNGDRGGRRRILPKLLREDLFELN